MKFKSIVFEGPDNTLKTTLSQMLAKKTGYKYVKFPNPDLDSGKIIQEYIEGKVDISPYTYQRLQNNNKILTLRSLGNETYIFDRYKLSEIVYGYLNGLSEKEIMELADQLPEPDLTIMMVGRSYGLDNDVFGTEEKQVKLKELFIQEAKKASGKIFYVSNERKIEQVFNEIVGILESVSL